MALSLIPGKSVEQTELLTRMKWISSIYQLSDSSTLLVGFSYTLWRFLALETALVARIFPANAECGAQRLTSSVPPPNAHLVTTACPPMEPVSIVCLYQG